MIIDKIKAKLKNMVDKADERTGMIILIVTSSLTFIFILELMRWIF